jgi:hypothetical protein
MHNYSGPPMQNLSGVDVKAGVKVRAYADGESAIFHGPASSGPLRP